MSPEPGAPSSPFDRPAIVDPYEDWFDTPYGRVAAGLELDMIVELLGAPRPGSAMLEIGCGTGWFARRLTEHGYRVTGVDPSRAMLARARDRVAVVQGDAARLPFADRSFDVAYLIAVLDFVPDPVAVLREARRVVRDRVAVIALARDSWLGVRRRISARRGHPIFSSARFYPRSRLLEFARESGAEPRDVRGALFLPPSLVPSAARVEQALRRRFLRGAGIVGFSLPSVGARHPEGI